MGSPLGQVLANSFVDYYKNSFLSRIQIKPLAYYRYVDSIFAIFSSKNNVNSFCTALNNIHKCIIFTVEEEIKMILSKVRQHLDEHLKNRTAWKRQEHMTYKSIFSFEHRNVENIYLVCEENWANVCN